MALAVRSASAEPAAAEVMTAFAQAGQLLQHLGNQHRGADTLVELCVAQPSLLKKWEKSTGRSPEHIEQRTFAKAMTSLLAVQNLVGWPLPVSGSSASTAASATSLPPTEKTPILAKRPRATFVKTMSSPAARLSRSALLTTISFWKWSPVFASLVIGFVLLIGARRPDFLCTLPCFFLRQMWNFGWFVVNSWCHQATHALDVWLTNEVHVNQVPALPPHQQLGSPAAPVTMILGWLAAAYFYNNPQQAA